MIRQPDPSSNIPAAYRKSSTAVASGYQSLPFENKRQAPSPYSGNTIRAGYMPGYTPKNPDSLSTVYCKTPQSLKSVPVNPIDLSSKRTLRATPDSTAVDDHAIYIDQEHKMIPAHSAQTFLPPGNHDRRLVDVSAAYVPHYGMNGVSSNHFGLIQGNGSIPPTTGPYDIFQQQRVSPSPTLSFAATHPLTTGILKRNSIYGNPSGTYEQYHPAGFPSAPPAGYQIQPNLPRVSGDPMTSIYQTSSAQGIRNNKHISNLDKNLPGIFAENQMGKTPSTVATTIASVTHSAPLQTTYIQELQPSSYHSHSAFQKPVFNKECCTVSMPNPCGCYWSPPEQPVSTYSPAHRIINPVQQVHSIPAVNKGAVSSGIMEARKPSPNFPISERSRMNHQITHHHIQHDGSHKNNHIEHSNHIKNHQENGIVGLQNTILKLTCSSEQIPRTSETNGIDHHPQNIYSCASDNNSKYNLEQIKSGPSNFNNNNNISRPNLTDVPNHVRDKGKQKANEQNSRDVTYCKTVAIKNKTESEYNLDQRQGTHPLKKVYYQKTQQSPGYYYDLLSNRNEKNVINYNKQQPNNNNNGENGSSSWANLDNSRVIQSHSMTGVMSQPVDSVSRVPNCWRPPVSFPENGENRKPGLLAAVHSVEKRADEYTGSGCDKYPYLINSIPPSTSNKQTIHNAVDDENRVSSTTDVVQPTSKTSNKQSQTLKHSPKERAVSVPNHPSSVSATTNLSKQSTSPQSKAAAASRAIQEKHRMLIIEAAEKKKLFDSYNFDLWIWCHRRRFGAGHYKNLVREYEEDLKITSKYDAKFPQNWEKDVALFKLSVRVPRSLIEFPDGFEPPVTVKNPEIIAVKDSFKDGNDSCSNSSKYGDTASCSGENSKCSQSDSIVNKLVNKYKKKFKTLKSHPVRSRQAESKSKSSDSESESDEEIEPEPPKHAETKCKKPPIKKIIPRTTRSAEHVKRSIENKQLKRSATYLSVRGRRRRDSDSEDHRARFSDDDSSDDESLSATNDGVRSKVKVPVFERRKEREAKRTTEKRAPRKRSPLDQLASSDGYVAENKKPKTDNLYSDTSLLGREQRALQRAMLQFNALELSHKKLHHGKKSKIKKKNLRKNVKIFKRQLRNRSVNISTKTDYEADVVKTRTKKQNGILRKVCIRRYNRNAAYEEEMSKEAHRITGNRIHKKLRSGPSLRSKSATTKAESPNQESGGGDYEDLEKSDDPIEDDDYKPYKPPINSSEASVKQMVTRSAGISMQNQWQSQQKKRLVYLRKRRFRSGLDMINFHKRQKRRREMCLKKYGANHFKERLEAIRVLKQKSEPVAAVTDGPPAELKKLMINKALGETILHRASRLGYSEVVLYCLDTNTNEVNSRDNAGYTPLHECCSRGHVNIANYLLQYGADPNASAAGGIRPIHDAIENNHVEIVRLLLSYGADPTITTYSGASPLKLAKSEQMAEFLKGFFCDVNGETSSSVWQFHGTGSIFDPENWGCNVFDNLPSTDSDCEEDNIVFEVSDKPHLPTFKLHPSKSSTDLLESGNYVLLQDVLSDLKTTQEVFTTKHRHINIVTLSKTQFIESVMQSQTYPQDDIHSSVSNIDRVQSKTVQLIPLDNDIRNILGVECITVR